MAEYIDAFQRAVKNKTTTPKITTPDNTAFGLTASQTPDLTATEERMFGVTQASTQTKPKAPVRFRASDGTEFNTQEELNVYQAALNAKQSGATLASNVVPPKQTLAIDTFKATLALFFGQSEMAKPWVNELYNVTSKYYKTGSTIDESFNLALQDSRNNPALTEFTKRFQGIYALQDKKAAGQAVSVPTIAEYYNAQAKMGDVLRQAGLGSIATEDYLGGVIGKGLSVTDVGNYISGIYTEIQNLPKDIKDSVMTNYPNMDSVSLAKAILTGDKGFTQLQKELTSQTIFGAAKRQGIAYDPILNPGGVTMERATEYAAEGLDLATGLTKFGQVAAAAPTVSKLSQITANKDLALTQANLESAVIKKTASEMRKMEQLTEEEVARYRGSAGTSKVSLKRPNGGF